MTKSPAFRPMFIIYGAMVWGVLSFLGVGAFLHQQQGPLGAFPPEQQKILALGNILMALGAIMISLLLKKQFYAQIQPNAPLLDRIATFRKAAIVGLALADAPAIFASLMYMLNANSLFILPVFISSYGFYLFRPFQSRFIQEMNLNQNEIDELASL